MIRSLRGAVILVAAIFSALGCGPAQPLKAGDRLPDFQMQTLDGQQLKASSLKGKVVIIDFWATWCPPCRVATKVFNELQSQYGSRGLVIIGASVSEKLPDNSAVTEYVREMKVRYLITVKNDRLLKPWGVDGLPTTLLIDRSGVIRWLEVGVSPSFQADLKAQIEKVL